MCHAYRPEFRWIVGQRLIGVKIHNKLRGSITDCVYPSVGCEARVKVVIASSMQAAAVCLLLEDAPAQRGASGIRVTSSRCEICLCR
jgi:hypothetical protein